MPDTIHVASTTTLLLGSRPVQEGDQLLLQIFGGWIKGVACNSRSGWYLLTAAQVRIGLSAGLRARWAEEGGSPSPGEGERCGETNEREERMWLDETQFPLWKAGEVVPAGVYVRIDDRSYHRVRLEQDGPLPASFDGQIACYRAAPAFEQGRRKSGTARASAPRKSS